MYILVFRHVVVIAIVMLICWHGVTRASCRAVMLTYCHTGMGHTIMPTCHADTRWVSKAGSRGVSERSKGFVCCGVVMLAHVWAHM